jgi:hypothetical protein
MADDRERREEEETKESNRLRRAILWYIYAERDQWGNPYDDDYIIRQIAHDYLTGDRYRRWPDDRKRRHAKRLLGRVRNIRDDNLSRVDAERRDFKTRLREELDKIRAARERLSPEEEERRAEDVEHKLRRMLLGNDEAWAFRQVREWRKRLEEEKEAFKKELKEIEKVKPPARTKELCPICMDTYLRGVFDEKGNVSYYYCDNPNCPASRQRISPEKLKETKKGKREKWRVEKPPAWRPREWLQKRREVFGSGKERRRLYREDVGDLREKRRIAKEDYKDALRDLKERSRREGWDSVRYHEERGRLKEKYRIARKEYREKKKGAKERRKGKTVQAAVTEKFNIMGLIPVLILVVLGLVISLYLRSMWFFFGFLCWAMVYILPKAQTYWPGPGIDKDNSYVNTKWLYIPHMDNFRNRHSGVAFIRSLFKGAAIFCLAFGFQTSTVPLSNLFLVLTAFIGYYTLNITYRREIPAEYIESFIRFAVLGIFLIPWIFFTVFDSFVLVLISWAFFAIPPVKSGAAAAEEKIVFYELPLKIIFLILMLLALIGSGALGAAIGVEWLIDISGWELKGTLSSVFLYFWLVTGLAGFFSPAETRPFTGFIMLGAAVVIFALGPGTQEVGQAMLGPWWPSFYVGFESVTKPIADLFGQLSQTLGMTFFMLTNPMGYAHSIMNGTYVTDPVTGYAGAYGVEIEEFRTTPIYVNQPFSVIVTVKNRGFSKADNITVSISSGYKAPKREGFWPGGETMPIKALGIIEGEAGSGVTCTSSNLCLQHVDGSDSNSCSSTARGLAVTQ